MQRATFSRSHQDYPGNYPNSKVHGANMGLIWGRQDPGGPHVGPMNFAIWIPMRSWWLPWAVLMIAWEVLMTSTRDYLGSPNLITFVSVMYCVPSCFIYVVLSLFNFIFKGKAPGVITKYLNMISLQWRPLFSGINVNYLNACISVVAHRHHDGCRCPCAK